MKPNEFRRNVLVDFKMLIDTDLGSAMYLKCNTTNKALFEDFVNTANLDFFRYKSLCRDEVNPIGYMFKEQYKGSSDTIYGELMANKWASVIEWSPITDITDMMRAGITTGYMVTVNCKNEDEKNTVPKLSHRFHAVINEEDVSKYDFLYIHYVRDIEFRKWNVDKKVIYLYNWKLNHVEFDDVGDTSLSVYAAPYIDKAIFNFINPYKEFVIPKG